MDGFVKLDPGAPLSRQEIKTCVSITGGDSDTDSFIVQYPALFQSQVIVDDTFMARRIQLQQETVGYAASVTFNFGSFGLKRIDLTGNLTVAAINMQNGRNLTVRFANDASLRALTWSLGWCWIGSPAPATLAANKVAILWLWCFGTAESDVMARWEAEA